MRGLSTRTTYITFKNNFRKRHQPSSDRRQAPLRTQQTMENRYECIQDPDRRGADLNRNDIIRVRSLVLRRSGAGSLCIDVPRSRRVEWRRADTCWTNGPRASRWRGARLRHGPASQPALASLRRYRKRASCALPIAGESTYDQERDRATQRAPRTSQPV